MKLLLLEKNRIIKTNLPKSIEGNYWITNESKKNLVNVEASDNKWILKSNRDVKLSLNEDDSITSFYGEIELEANKMYYITDLINDFKYRLYCENTYDNELNQYSFSHENVRELIIGNDLKSSLQVSVSNDIKCNIDSFAKNQIKISFLNNCTYIYNLNIKVNMYINDTLYENK